MKYFLNWLGDRSGVSGLEYGILGGGISLAIATAVFLGGENLASIFSTINDFMAQNL